MLQKDWNVDFVGILATEEDVPRRNIIINSQNALQYFVKLISETPYGFPNVKLFTCYSSDLVRYGFEDDYYRPDDERIEKLQRFLYDYLLVFCSQKKVLPNHNEIYIGKEVRLIRKSDSYLSGSTFIPVPVFSQEEHGSTFEELVNKLTGNRFIGRIDNLSTDENDTPEFILWRQKEKYKVLGVFDRHQYAHGGYSLHVASLLKAADVEDRWLEDCYNTVDNTSLLFVPLDIHEKLSVLIEQAEPIHHAEEEVELQLTASAGFEATIAETMHTEVLSTEAVMEVAVLEPSTSMSIASTVDEEEARFMEHFIQSTREMGLQYKEVDLYNLHTSLKSSTLNIIAGMSGTGKSKLVQAYARALGLDDDQFVIIPVRPSWTDDADLIGYVDAINMVYRPGDSGLINTLIQAQKEENRKSKLYLICFDEMNLARVEHYFSPFLSVLEMEPQRRFLRLYNDDLMGRLYNTAQYEPVITIPENVMFVGTVNIDESTYHFSDKVLDRANVITLDVLPYTGLKQLNAKERKPSREYATRKTPLTYEEFNHFRSLSEGFSMDEREAELFWKMHLLLHECNKNLGVGPRVVRQIDAYLQNLIDNPYLSRREALDIQLVQRILTKLRGPEGLLKELIGKVDGAGNMMNSQFNELLQQYEDISDFTETRKVLVHKAKELKINGYTI